MSAQDWISEVNSKVKQSVENRKPMINEDGIKTEPQDPGFMYELPWDRFVKTGKKTNTVSSFVLSDYHKAILEELKARTSISDRKRITMIVEKALEEFALQMKNDKI